MFYISYEIIVRVAIRRKTQSSLVHSTLYRKTLRRDDDLDRRKDAYSGRKPRVGIFIVYLRPKHILQFKL